MTHNHDGINKNDKALTRLSPVSCLFNTMFHKY